MKGKFDDSVTPDYFFHYPSKNVYQCVGRDDRKYWAQIDTVNEAIGFDEGDCEAATFVTMDNCVVVNLSLAWPLNNVLEKLIDASEILLDKKDYDGFGWEEIRHAINSGKKILDKLNNIT